MSSIVLKHINKCYKNTDRLAIDDFNLEIEDKEFIVFVGPSGCGKSTTLRMIAGLEDISDGELLIDGTWVNDKAPKDRDIAMVFQNYALYPHMTVYGNISFGLKLRKFSKQEIDRRVKEVAKILGLEDYLNRKPKALSGGQMQRVALGRAMVRNPKVFLMDEPLSNLDAKLRVQMRSEIVKLHRRLNTTTIYVTHDQTEAMTMADRIVIMKDGVIQQIGTPKELYQRPANMFVGSFIGAPAMNFISVRLSGNKLLLGDLSIELPEEKIQKLTEKGYADQSLILGVRPENIQIVDTQADEKTSASDAIVDSVELLGAESIIYTMLGNKEMIIKSADATVGRGDHVKLAFNMDKALLFDPETEQCIG